MIDLKSLFTFVSLVAFLMLYDPKLAYCDVTGPDAALLQAEHSELCAQVDGNFHKNDAHIRQGDYWPQANITSELLAMAATTADAVKRSPELARMITDWEKKTRAEFVAKTMENARFWPFVIEPPSSGGRSSLPLDASSCDDGRAAVCTLKWATECANRCFGESTCSDDCQQCLWSTTPIFDLECECLCASGGGPGQSGPLKIVRVCGDCQPDVGPYS